MSFMKRDAEERDTAYSILIEIGAIKTCPLHDDWYYTTGMESGLVYGAATNKYKEYMKTDSVPQTFRDKIKVILDEGSLQNECPYCAKL